MAAVAPRPVRKKPIQWTRILRRSVQAGFLIFIVVASLRHNLLPEQSAPSLDALCPMGGLETLWRMIVEGRYIPKTHPSNLVLGAGLLIGTLLAGAAFCGWICPFGTLQDGLTWLRNKVRIPAVKVPQKLDRWLRYGRFVVLALVLFKTADTVKLWFAGYDPYRTIFSMGWLFEFNLAEQWPAYLTTLIVLGGAFFIPRAWCKYACPLGGALSLLGHFSFLRIKRNAESCKGCSVCEKPCPVGLPIADVKRVSPDCIGCLECVQACPRSNTLDVYLAPAWADELVAHIRKTKPSSTPLSGE